MPFSSFQARRSRRHSQRGQAMLLVVMLFGMAAALLVYGMVDTNTLAVRRDQDTAAALAMAKQALIGRAVSDDDRPGSLLCPDAVTDIVGNVPDDGVADLFIGNDCPTYIGRLPWKTLGLPDLRDSDGERLWYALSNNFRDDNSAQPINSDTKGNRTVYSGSTAVTLTAEAVAVVFAPGTTLAGQIRDGAAALCPTTGTTIARNLCAANYVEATGGANNAALGGAGPFISAQNSAGFNDRLLVITTAELMPPVEQRVAREIRALLQSYKTASSDGAGPLCDCYPWAANDFNHDSVSGRTRGGVPIDQVLPETWASLVITVPPWIKDNRWGKVFYYAVAPAETASHSPTTTLTVDGVSKNVVLITPGPAGASRPSANLPDYLDDGENSNNNDVFCGPGPSATAPCTPTSAYARDRLYTINTSNTIP